MRRILSGDRHSTNLAGILNQETVERRQDAFFKNYKNIHYLIKPAQTELDGTKKYPLKTATTFQPASKIYVNNCYWGI